MKRITSNAFAYRHTSERISQHSNIRRANLYLVCIKYLCDRDRTCTLCFQNEEFCFALLRRVQLRLLYSRRYVRRAASTTGLF